AAAGLDLTHPFLDPVPATVGEDVGELVDLLVGGGQRLTAVENLLQVEPFVLIDAVGVAGQPAGDLPDAGRHRERRRRGEGGTERLEAAAHRLRAAPVAHLFDLAGQRGSVGTPGVDPRV